MAKSYTIAVHRKGRVTTYNGTVADLVEVFQYTLDTGHSWQHEKGNKKINTKPTTMRSLVCNLNAATNNAAMNGYSGVSYEEVK